MSEGKWTPGPWAYRPHELDDWGTVWAANGRVVATASLAQSNCTLSHARHSGYDPVEANAHLIAAAPDMAEALEAVTRKAVNIWGAAPDDIDIINALAALAKARGEST